MLERIKKIGLFILLFILFLYSDLIYLVPLSYLGIDINSFSYNIQTIFSLFSSFVLAIIIIVIYKNYLKEKLIDFKKNFKFYFDDGMKYWFIGLVGMCVTNLLIGIFSPVNEANNEVLVQEMLKLSPILSFISATFFAPFLEEMLFRKSLGDIFKNKKVMVIVSGLVFGLLHVVFSLETPWDLLYVVPYGFLGSAFAYMLDKYENVFVPITFHMLHNGMLTFISILPTILGLGA